MHSGGCEIEQQKLVGPGRTTLMTNSRLVLLMITCRRNLPPNSSNPFECTHTSLQQQSWISSLVPRADKSRNASRIVWRLWWRTSSAGWARFNLTNSMNFLPLLHAQTRWISRFTCWGTHFAYERDWDSPLHRVRSDVVYSHVGHNQHALLQRRRHTYTWVL